jgi:hypothetical protein
VERQYGVEVVDGEGPSDIERADMLDVPGKGMEGIRAVE